MHANIIYLTPCFGALFMSVPAETAHSPHLVPALHVRTFFTPPLPETGSQQAPREDVARYSSGFMKPWGTFHMCLGTFIGETPRCEGLGTRRTGAP